MFKFSNILLESPSEMYHFTFKFAYPDQKSTYINIYFPLSAKEKEELSSNQKKGALIKNMAYSSKDSFDAWSDKTKDISNKPTGELYTIIYDTINQGKKKYREPHAKTIHFIYSSSPIIEKFTKKIKDKKLTDKDIEIHKTNFEELMYLLKGKTINNQYSHKLLSESEVSNIIDDLAKKKGEAQTDIKTQKELEKKQKKDTEKTEKPEEPSEEIPEFSKEEKIEGAKFFTDDINDLLSSIIQAHAVATNLNNKPNDILDAKKDRYEKVNLFVDELKKFTKDENLTKVIFLYFLNTKIPKQYSSVYKYIASAYVGAPLDSIKKDTAPTKGPQKKKSTTKKQPEKNQDVDTKIPKSAAKPDLGEKKYKFDLTIVDPKGEDYVAEKKLTLSQAKEIEKVAKQNLVKYEKYQKDLDAELKKMQTDPTYTPNVDLNADFGIIGIKLKSEISEMSATGTGAAVSPGEGEGVATKYAFAGAGGTKAKRKKGIVQTNSAKIIKADESYRIKNDAKSIFWESVRWLINNK